VKTKFEVSDALSLTLIGGACASTLALYSKLPERFPTHFNVHGVANAWMSRSVGAFILPVAALVTWALVRLGAPLLPSAWRARLEESPAGLVVALVVGFLASLHGVVLYAVLTGASSLGMALNIVLGGFFVALGLVFPRLRRNPWIGVRTPWTLSSDENWARTHRVAGIAFCVGGGLALVATLAGQGVTAIAFIITSSIVPAVYSFFLARRLPPQSR
jgi:uncharacterized membrane protein